MNEQVSALVDGELDESEMARLLSRLDGDPELVREWETCHLIGDALRGHYANPIAGGVTRRLQAEPTLLAPRRRRANVAHQGARRYMSIAAGVAAVVLVGWMAVPLFLEESRPQVAQAQPAAEVQNYILAHQRYSPSSAMQGVAPYVRLVTVESGGGRQ